MIHEWGTFTSLQDETGKAIGGINTDDEPVQRFVHRLASLLLLNPTQCAQTFFQGVPHCHPDVTMRLETPVLYFHPAKGQPTLENVNVTATFRGGWLTEFYPETVATAPGVTANTSSFGRLRSDTLGTLSWKNLAIGEDWPGPETSKHVWTAPRDVQAANVRTANQESERFLFYRGVAHLDAPLKVSREGDELVLRSHVSSEVAGSNGLRIPSLWLVDIREDGQLALRELPPVTLDVTGKVLARVSAHFNSSDYRRANLETLRSSLHRALMADGLRNDEAEALLNTWELSYFKSAGMRVFFLVPRAWTDHFLPLDISVPAQINRTMVGRIELVTPEQCEILAQLGRCSAEEIKADGEVLIHNIVSTRDYVKLTDGQKTLADAGVSVPKSYQLYVRLGRFRNALLLEDEQHHPAAGLASFISEYNLDGYKPVD